MKYTDIIFDIDGTLIDSEKTSVLSFLRTMKELTGETWSYEEGCRIFGIQSQKVPAYVGYDDEKTFMELWEKYYVEMRSLSTVFPGVEDILKSVRKAGLRTGIVSSRSKEEYDNDTRFTPFAGYFDHVVLAGDTERCKPFPDPIYKYIEMASEGLEKPVDVRKCIYVGDTLHDCGCAHAAGCDFALADWYQRGMQDIPADFRFTDASGAISILLDQE